VSLFKFYLTFSLLGIVGMHRDVERTLIITISEKIKNKKKRVAADYVCIH